MKRPVTIMPDAHSKHTGVHAFSHPNKENGVQPSGIKSYELPIQFSLSNPPITYDAIHENIATIIHNQEIIDRGVEVAKQSPKGTLLKTIGSLFSLAGKEYKIPDLEETLELQMDNLKICSDHLSTIGKYLAEENKKIVTYVTQLFENNAATEKEHKKMYMIAEKLVAKHESIENNTTPSHMDQSLYLTRRNIRNASNNAMLAKVKTDLVSKQLQKQIALDDIFTQAITTNELLHMSVVAYLADLQEFLGPLHSLGKTTYDSMRIIQGLRKTRGYTNTLESEFSNAVLCMQSIIQGEHLDQAKTPDIAHTIKKIDMQRNNFIGKIYRQ